MNRYKPVGWRGDSHRHYLAAKGISTRKYSAGFAGTILQRKFKVADVQRKRAVTQGSVPARAQLSAQRGQIRSPLTDAEEATRLKLLKGLGASSGSTPLELQRFWTPNIGREIFEDAAAELEVAKNRRAAATQANNTQGADLDEAERAKLGLEFEDSGRALKIAIQQKKEASEVLTGAKRLDEGLLNAARSLKVRTAQGNQVKKFQREQARRDERIGVGA